MYLFLAVLSLRHCGWTFSTCGEQGLLFLALRGLLVAETSLVEPGFCGAQVLVVVALVPERRLNRCGTRA